MRKLILIAVVFLLFATSSAFAQKIEAGIFLDYLGISQTSTNNFGLGARFGRKFALRRVPLRYPGTRKNDG